MTFLTRGGRFAVPGAPSKVMLGIFAIALAVRAAEYAFRLLALPGWPPWLPGPNIWADSNVYLADLHYVTSGFLPYRDFQYNYGPAYLYAMLPFYLISPALSYVPTLLADSCTAVVVWSVARRNSTERIALAAGLGYAVFPFAILNEGYLLMSSQPMTFFVALSVLFAAKRYPMGSMLALAVAALFKQEALFVALPLILWNARSGGLKTAKAVGAGAALYGLVLLPFFLASPQWVTSSLLYGNFIRIWNAAPHVIGQTSFQSVSGMCGTTTIAGVFAGTVCGSVFNTQAFAAFLAAGKFWGIVAELELPLLVVFAFGLIAVRRSPALLGLSCAFATIGLALLFAAYVHGLYAYYFLPVYVFLLMGVTDKNCLLISIVTLTLISFSPEGQLQVIIPLAAATAMIVVESVRLEKHPGAPAAGVSRVAAQEGPPEPLEHRQLHRVLRDGGPT